MELYLGNVWETGRGFNCQNLHFKHDYSLKKKITQKKKSVTLIWRIFFNLQLRRFHESFSWEPNYLQAHVWSKYPFDSLCVHLHQQSLWVNCALVYIAVLKLARMSSGKYMCTYINNHIHSKRFNYWSLSDLLNHPPVHHAAGYLHIAFTYQRNPACDMQPWIIQKRYIYIRYRNSVWNLCRHGSDFRIGLLWMTSPISHLSALIN